MPRTCSLILLCSIATVLVVGLHPLPNVSAEYVLELVVVLACRRDVIVREKEGNSTRAVRRRVVDGSIFVHLLFSKLGARDGVFAQELVVIEEDVMGGARCDFWT